MDQFEAWTMDRRNEIKSITVSDVGRKDLKIEILIGADVAGALLTGKIRKLENRLVAVESLLGCTAMERINYYTSESNVSMPSVITSMLVQSNDIENLLKLEVLGITDSKEYRSDVELQEAAWDHFHITLKRTDDRYEVFLTWIDEKYKLPSNREVAKKRLISTTKKLMLQDKTDAYNVGVDASYN
ncbi:hypothetical protein HNY73_010441 [Argiope bruennichi]|uniref:Uncharacterized protein n=1 Tax=Argiope bruennichi TaxID=94029 RepID=A0A8T0F5Y0_ARGBR|nr:hypothetical protein HNY73_010441 [Argiope bruennichi]